MESREAGFECHVEAIAQEEVRREVREFAAALEAKLLRKIHRKLDGDRLKMPPRGLLLLMKGEIHELEAALEYESLERGMEEAVDAANYALLIWKRLKAMRDEQEGK